MNKLRKIATFAALAFFAVVGLAAFAVPQDTCNLVIENTNTTGSPIYEPDCTGNCDAGACELDSTTDMYSTEWSCDCDGQDVDTKCAATFRFQFSPPLYSISCAQNGCVNTCVKAGLPVQGGTTMKACACLDVE